MTTPPSPAPDVRQRVVIAGLDLPFEDLVLVLLKLVIAAIPAAIVGAVVGSLLWYLVAALMP